MTDYTELVKALRDEDNCNVLSYIDDAADAIEALQAENTDIREELFISQRKYDEFTMIASMQNALLAKKLPKRGEWIWMQKANGGQYKGCSVCHAPIPTDSMLDYLDDDDCEFCYSCGAKMEVPKEDA